MGHTSGVILRAMATSPSLWFIVIAGPVFSNWTQHEKPLGSKLLRARRPSGCWRTRATPFTTSRQNSAMSVLARDEVRQRIDVERLQFEEALTTVQEELATERALRGRAQRERDEATVATQTAEQRRRTTVKAAQSPPAPFPADQPPRRRGRPPKVARQDAAPDDSEIVEWWSPGWQEKYR
jgi:hypothetical protein